MQSGNAPVAADSRSPSPRDPSGSAGVFARESTGLVREVSPIDAAIVGASNAPVGQFVVFALPVGLGLFAAASAGWLVAAIVIAAAFTIPTLINYATLSSAMPRSGGDYVFSTRLLTPWLGFASNFTLALWQVFAAGAWAALVVPAMLVPLVSTVGGLTGSSALSELATTMTEPGWRIAIAITLITAISLMLVTGTQRTLRVNSIFWSIGMLAMTLLIVILLFTSRDGFVATFNEHAGNPDAYQQVIREANAAGFAERSGPLMLWGLVALTMGVFGVFFWMTYFGGEIKQARSWKREVGMMFSPLAINFVYVMAITLVMMKTFGFEFLGATMYLSLVDPGKLPGDVASGPAVFLTALTAGSDVLATLFAVTFAAWGWVLLTCLLVMPVRCAFAWSLDQILPSGFVRVSPRWGTPIALTIGVAAIAATVAVIGVYEDKVFQIFGAAVLASSWFSAAIGGLAAAFFPRRMPSLYRQQPISRVRILGVPALVVTGIVGFAYTTFWCLAYWRFSEELGMTTGLAITVFSPFLIGLAIYFAARAYRRSQGIPIDLAFKQIPPE